MNLSNDYLSAFCLQISLLLHAGISIGDGLHMLSEDEEDPAAKKILQSMSEQVDNGLQISEVMEQSECFPDYVVYMTRTGEETGRTEEAFKALSDYALLMRLVPLNSASGKKIPFSRFYHGKFSVFNAKEIRTDSAGILNIFFLSEHLVSHLDTSRIDRFNEAIIAKQIKKINS